MADIVYHNGLAKLMDGSLTTSSMFCMLADSNYTPNADDTTYASIATDYEITAANGYVGKGQTLSSVTIAADDSLNLVKFDSENPTWTASGGDIGPARYAIVHDGTDLLYNFDMSSDQTAGDGTEFLVTVSTAGWFTAAQA